MKKFLEIVAEDIINKYGTDLSRIAVVFPNKRASIFLNEQLAIKAKKPLWSPAYITISDFFLQYSSLAIGDPIKLVCDLHKSFTECTGIDETLDHFYGWGQLLLTDFDDIDKNLADASKVFKNVKNIHELDDISYLDEEQKKILRKFFSNFNKDNETELKKRFLNLWCHFEDIYNNFKQRLYEQGIAYEGMLYRDVALKKDLDFQYDMYLFVGFNVIQKVEQKMFAVLREQDKARFYWDFDKYYMPAQNRTDFKTEHEAGRYITRNLYAFPNELDSSDALIYDNFGKKKEITFVNASTENIQARYINDWLKTNKRFKGGRNTAIVLCNESLLPTAIHYLPQEVEEVNITTGFPLFQTPVSSLISQLLELRINGYSVNNETFRLHYVKQILSHPYSRYISEKCATLLTSLKNGKIFYPKINLLSADDNLETLFKLPTDNNSLVEWLLKIIRIVADNVENDNKNPLLQESLFRMYTLCNRINELIKSGDLDVDIITLQKLIMQLINSTSIPFHGEPAEGIQIMGILETRNLDFDNVLILSCNEGNMPKGINDSSFIPYSIRKAYELTTIDNKIAIYAYYFYNLIQRATDITIAYNKSTDNGQSSEMSRFMLQLMIESGNPIKHMSLQPNLQLIFKQPRAIKKNAEIMARLDSMTYISPTAINRYMRCPLQFSYNNVAKLREKDDIEEDGLDNRTFGNVFHEASEIIYRDFIGVNTVITEQTLRNILKNGDVIERVVDKAIMKVVFNQDANQRKHPEYTGLQIINREVIIKYLTKLLEIDASLTPFKIMDVETDVYKDISISTSNGNRTIKAGGRIDRLDCITDAQTGKKIIRVVDYKTGRASTKKVNSIDEIFIRPIEQGKHADYFLQIMLYSVIVRKDEKFNNESFAVSPTLLFIQNSPDTNYNPIIDIGNDKVSDIIDYEEEFSNHISEILSEIFEPNIPFLPTEDNATCANCPYRNLCGI